MSNEPIASRAALLLVLAASACSVVACGSPSDKAEGESSDLDTENVQADKVTQANLVGTWVPASAADLTAATFTTLTLQSNWIWYESGQGFDGTISAGVYSMPTSVPVGSSYGAPPAGITGPYLQLADNSKGDGQWDYGALQVSTDGTKLTMTLYAQRFGMGLRWAKPTVVHLVKKNAALPPLGTWKPATAKDETNAGFSTLTVSGGGAWSETGRTDGDTDSQGMYSEPLTVPITDPSFGSPPAGMHGPYLQLAETGDNDGDWIYGFVESTDQTKLTLNLYARSLGMGLRWANPSITIQLVSSTTVTTPTVPIGSWKPASTTDKTNAGFATLTLNAAGTWTETGRTDGDSDPEGNYTEPSTITVGQGFGNPDPTMHGPFVSLGQSNAADDGQWVYGYTESADGTKLTLVEYANTLGMGLRWKNPALTIQLVKN